MPRMKNSFKSPDHREETIVDQDGAIIGTIRISPASLKWKPRRARQWYTVSLAKFTNWIAADETKARKVDK